MIFNENFETNHDLVSTKFYDGRATIQIYKRYTPNTTGVPYMNRQVNSQETIIYVVPRRKKRECWKHVTVTTFSRFNMLDSDNMYMIYKSLYLKRHNVTISLFRSKEDY